MTDFPGIKKQAKWIAKLYKFFGLWSIPVLTIATTISIANVFTHGQIATDTRLQFAWAFLFAAAIEVNIVRLFFEWKLDKDKGAFVLGIVLAIVAGAALLIEGLQQSIGFDWNNVYVQWTVAIVIAARVLVVVLLLAREGSKLASAMVEDVQPMYACLVSFPAPVVIPEPTPEMTPAIHLVTTPKRTTLSQNTATRIRAIVAKSPDIKIEELARKAGVSVRTAQRHKPRQRQEA